MCFLLYRDNIKMTIRMLRPVGFLTRKHRFIYIDL